MKINEFAIIHGVPVRKLAKELGISWQAVYLYNKKQNITLRSLVKLCNAFEKFGVKITPGELLKELTEKEAI